MPLEPGLVGVVDAEVTPDDLADALGSGDVPVLGTPRVVALLEAATVAALVDRLDPGATTVGTRVAVDHLAATPVGRTVRATAELEAVEGRILRFAVSAHDGVAEIARGHVQRAVVDRERFVERSRAS